MGFAVAPRPNRWCRRKSQVLSAYEFAPLKGLAGDKMVNVLKVNMLSCKSRGFAPIRRSTIMNFMTKHRDNLIRFGKMLGFTAAILVTTKLTLVFGGLANASTTAFSFLIIVLLSAFFGDLLVAITTSIVATLCFDYFYLPPVGTFYIAAFSDWISLAAFLLALCIISRSYRIGG